MQKAFLKFANSCGDQTVDWSAFRWSLFGWPSFGWLPFSYGHNLDGHRLAGGPVDAGAGNQLMQRSIEAKAAAWWPDEARGTSWSDEAKEAAWWSDDSSVMKLEERLGS